MAAQMPAQMPVPMAPPIAAPPQPGYQPPPAQGFAPPMPEPAREMSGKALRGFLVAYQNNPNGEFWALTGGRHSVGRANSGENTDIPLAEGTISSRHAAIVVDGGSGAIMVEDTGSTNGTFVNDEHLGFNGRRELRDGDRIRFGGFTTIVKVIGRV
jgi:pSer/pThr/pTyr-binding forkhead associated (FHA) protein